MQIAAGRSKNNRVCVERSRDLFCSVFTRDCQMQAISDVCRQRRLVEQRQASR